MPQCKFVIGEKEKHEVEMRIPRWFLFKFLVKVDGEVVLKKHKLYLKTDTISIKIDDKEIHEVEVKISWPWFVWEKIKINVFVDGKLQSTF